MVDAIIIRYGEVFLKQGRRKAFLKVLGRNIRASLRSLEETFIREPYGRFLVRGAQAGPLRDPDSVIQALRRVPGIVSVSPCMIVPKDVEAIERTAVFMAGGARFRGKRTFRVEARRQNKDFPFNSQELNRVVGSAVERETSLEFRLEGYEYCLGIEVRRHEAWLFDETLPGIGGLPVGSNGRVLLLLSGGIDSPVAGYLTLKRGSPVDCLYFHAPPYTSEKSLEKVMDISRTLSTYQGETKLHVVKFTEVQETIIAEAPEIEAVVLYRRSMFRLADRVARKLGIQALATGECLGQVASQTVENMFCIHGVTDLPVLQPCIGLDKTEIVRTAKQIGTYPISIRPFQDCCSLFVPKHPDLRPDPGKIEKMERSLGLEGLYERILGERMDFSFNEIPFHGPQGPPFPSPPENLLPPPSI